MPTRIFRKDNYLIAFNETSGQDVEYPVKDITYVENESVISILSIYDSTIHEQFRFADLRDEDGNVWVDLDVFLDWMRKNTGADIPTNGLDVNLQDQTTPAIIAKLSTVDAESTLTIATAIDDRTITVVDGNDFLLEHYLSIFDIVSNRFYLANITNVNVNVLTLDTPLDFAYPIGSFVTGGITNMAVDGSVTPVIFGLRNTEETIGITADITRLFFTLLSTNAPAYDDFGDILNGLNNGIVLRKKDGDYKNIFNLKTNGELAGIMFDVSAADAVNPNQGQNGYIARLTFAGQNKIGVTIRLIAGEDLQMIIQDDLTSLVLLEVVAEGHEVLN